MAIKAQSLYINVDSNNPQTALVQSATSNSPKSLGSVVAGDTLRYVITAVDSNGVSAISGDPNIQVRVGIGGLGDGSPKVYSTNFVATGSQWSGSLNANTGSLTTHMGTEDTYNAYLEVELVVTGSTAPDSGSRYTVLQAPLKVLNQVIPS